MSIPSEPYPSDRPPDRSYDRPPAGAANSGWITFAAIILFLNGCFAAFWGLAAILNDDIVTVGGEGVVIWDITAWGWATLILGIIMVLTAIGLFSGNRAARWLGVIFALINALFQFGIATAFPLWAILIIALDVIVIYHLVASWDPQSD